jgi:hypothetical protein
MAHAMSHGLPLAGSEPYRERSGWIGGYAIKCFQGNTMVCLRSQASPTLPDACGRTFFATFDGETDTRIVSETRASLPALLEADDHHRRVGRPGRI